MKLLQSICLSSLECKRSGDIFLFILKLFSRVSDSDEMRKCISGYLYEMEDKRYLCLIQESQTLWYNLNSPHFWEVL